MREKKLTDDEIIKALECCTEDDNAQDYNIDYCQACPLYGTGCLHILRGLSLDLIHRLQSENERLVKEKSKEVKDLVKENAEQKAEIEQLTEENKRLSVKVWNYEKPAVPSINYAEMVHCNIADCYRENNELRTKNYELQKQVDEFIKYPCKIVAGDCLILCKTVSNYDKLKRLIAEQSVKDTAKEILTKVFKCGVGGRWLAELCEEYGVEVE